MAQGKKSCSTERGAGVFLLSERDRELGFLLRFGVEKRQRGVSVIRPQSTREAAREDGDSSIAIF